MTTQTTINMNTILLIEIGRASKQLNISKTAIIRLLLKKFHDEADKMQIFKSPVRYQPRDENGNWTLFHLNLHEDEYELCQDLRKIFKMSLSFIIAVAVKKHLKKIIVTCSNKTASQINDIYMFRNYFFSSEIINGIRKITIYWGITDFEMLLHDNYRNII